MKKVFQKVLKNVNDNELKIQKLPKCAIEWKKDCYQLLRKVETKEEAPMVGPKIRYVGGGINHLEKQRAKAYLRSTLEEQKTFKEEKKKQIKSPNKKKETIEISVKLNLNQSCVFKDRMVDNCKEAGLELKNIFGQSMPSCEKFPSLHIKMPTISGVSGKPTSPTNNSVTKNPSLTFSSKPSLDSVQRKVNVHWFDEPYIRGGKRRSLKKRRCLKKRHRLKKRSLRRRRKQYKK